MTNTHSFIRINYNKIFVGFSGFGTNFEAGQWRVLPWGHQPLSLDEFQGIMNVIGPSNIQVGRHMDRGPAHDNVRACRNYPRHSIIG